MENRRENHFPGNGFLLGLLLGIIIAVLFTTKKGRRILRMIIDEGEEKLAELEKLIEKNQETQAETIVEDVEDQTLSSFPQPPTPKERPITKPPVTPQKETPDYIHPVEVTEDHHHTPVAPVQDFPSKESTQSTISEPQTPVEPIIEIRNEEPRQNEPSGFHIETPQASSLKPTKTSASSHQPQVPPVSSGRRFFRGIRKRS